MSVLYISDLDGTLLTNEPSLSEFSRATLMDLLASGLPFSVASARSVVSIRKMLRNLPLSLPVVEFNGAFLSDLKTGRHELINDLKPHVAREIYELVLKFDCTPFVSTFNGREDCLHYCQLTNDGMQWYFDDRVSHRDPRLRRSHNLVETLREQVVCLTFIGDAALLGDVMAAIQVQHGGEVAMNLMENQYSRGWHWLTVHDRAATKDQGVRALMGRYDMVDASLVVFGDEVNDIPLFRVATHAVAVANASPDLKLHATHVIGPNQEDSVVRYIRDHWRTTAIAPSVP